MAKEKAKAKEKKERVRKEPEPEEDEEEDPVSRKVITHWGVRWKNQGIYYQQQGLWIGLYYECKEKTTEGKACTGRLKCHKAGEFESFNLTVAHTCAKCGPASLLEGVHRYGDHRARLERTVLPFTCTPSVVSTSILRSMLEEMDERVWKPLNGGGGKRDNIPKLMTGKEYGLPAMKAKVASYMAPVLDWLQKNKHPHLRHYHFNILRSLEGALAQDNIHRDFGQEFLELPPGFQPMSLLFGLDSFHFMYRMRGFELMVDEEVPPRQPLVFSNRLEHCGGPNPLGRTCYRIFVFLCKDASQVPKEVIYPVEHPAAVALHQIADRVEDPVEREMVVKEVAKRKREGATRGGGRRVRERVE